MLRLALVAAVCGACGESDKGSDNGDGGDGDGDGDGDGSIVGDGGASGGDAGMTISELGPGLVTLAGFAASGFVDGPREVASFNNPVNVEVGPDGLLYVADWGNSAIRTVTADGDVSTLSYTEATGFVRPFGMTFTPDGRLFVQADRSIDGFMTGALWEIDLMTGDPELALSGDELGRNRGLASMSDGRLVLTDYLAHYVRIYDPDTGVDTLLAGMPDTPGSANGTGTSARFNQPYGTVVVEDEIFVVDHMNHRIRKITAAGTVTTVAGTGNAGSQDGALLTASFNLPKAITVAEDGAFYVTDTGSGTIRRVSIADNSVTTVAGTGIPGFGDHEDPLQAQLFGIEGVTYASGYLYIADGNAGEGGDFHRIRRREMADLFGE